MKQTKRREFLQCALLAGASVLVPDIGLSATWKVLAELSDQASREYSFYPTKETAIIEQIVSGRALLTRGEKQLRLNEVGTFVWQHIDGAKSTYCLAKLVTDRYQICFTEALEHSEQFVFGLQKVNFIELLRQGPCYRLPA
jgi:hypothetical protein